MPDASKKDKVKIITLLGMAVMIIAVAIKAATSSVLAAAAMLSYRIRYSPMKG